MSVDVEIYMSGFQKFFEENPDDLLNLIPKGKENQFYSKVRKVATSNYEIRGEACLTQPQLLSICRELNLEKIDVSKHDSRFVKTKFGIFSLN